MSPEEVSQGTVPRTLIRSLAYLLLGAVVFWVPSIVLHAIRGYGFSGFDVIALTVVLPAVTCLSSIAIWRVWEGVEVRLLSALLVILGIWAFGPLMMSIDASFSGGGFSRPGGWRLVLKGTALFPIITFMMSTYDGTLGALLLITVLLPLLAGWHLKKSAGAT